MRNPSLVSMHIVQFVGSSSDDFSINSTNFTGPVYSFQLLLEIRSAQILLVLYNNLILSITIQEDPPLIGNFHELSGNFQKVVGLLG